MRDSPQDQITGILLEPGGPEASAVRLDRLVPLVYDELRAMAGHHLRRDGADLTLSPTELVHEAYLRLADATRVTARGRAYFFAAAAKAMRRIIVDHARRRNRLKRGGGKRAITLQDTVAVSAIGRVDVQDLEAGLDRLIVTAERAARVVECRFYGGLTIEDTALALGVTARTVKRDWQFARAWLYDYLTASRPDGPG
jgi:RNA polymerase sigma factor (TIGR02999 family)